MPYYHVFIEYVGENGEECYSLETNVDSQILMDNVAPNYMKGHSFVFLGKSYERDKIRKIFIFQSDDRFERLILPDGQSVVGQDVNYVVACFFNGMVKGVKDNTDWFITSHPREKKGHAKIPFGEKTKVFIVHGRDDKPKLELARMLEKLGFKVIILSEQPDKGRTIIEKLEQETIDIGYAFVILTPDDVGMERGLFEKMSAEPEKYRDVGLCYRARQNVALELGYFVGKFGRNRVCCLYKGNVELPSDIHGVLFKKFNETVEECYKGILDELKAAGYEIKM